MLRFTLLAAAVFMLLAGIACSGGGWTPDDRYEGITKHRMRIYVRLPYREADSARAIHDNLVRRAQVRCRTLLDAYIETHYAHKNSREQAVRLIPVIVASPSMVYNSCTADYCEAFLDFDVKALAGIRQP